jgi:restriction system protein
MTSRPKSCWSAFVSLATETVPNSYHSSTRNPHELPGCRLSGFAAGRPLHYIEIAARAIEQGLIAPTGKTPEASMGSLLYVDTKKENSRFTRAQKGCFSLSQRRQVDDISQRVAAINDRTRKELRRLLHSMPADQFEVLVGGLLLALGFEEDSVVVTPYGGDGGVDVRGVLHAGGITRIEAAVQVKRWKNNVQAPVVRNLRGSLTSQQQGIIITTSGFSKGAIDEAHAVGKTPISLVDGDLLLDLLVEHEIGVTKAQHTVHGLDEEWWGELLNPEPAPAPEPKPAPPPRSAVTYPLTIAASNKPGVMALLLNGQGHVEYDGKTYVSPSTVGKLVTGWTSCNGWRYWRYQHPETGEWRLIDELRGK